MYGVLCASKAGQNATFPWNMIKNGVKNVIFLQIFRDFCKKKTELSILNYIFSLKIAKISLQKHNFLGIQHFVHACGRV